jgi:hypothetical protein
MIGALNDGLSSPIAVPGIGAPGLGFAGAGGAGGSAITVNVYTGIGDPVRIGREVHEALRAYERASGPQD